MTELEQHVTVMPAAYWYMTHADCIIAHGIQQAQPAHAAVTVMEHTTVYNLNERLARTSLSVSCLALSIAAGLCVKAQKLQVCFGNAPRF